MIKGYFSGLLLLLTSASASACGVPGDKLANAGCVFGLGMAFVTAPIAIIDYGVSKSSDNERLISSDKQVEFIVGLPLAFAAFNYFFLDKSESSSFSSQSTYIGPYVAGNETVGVSFYSKF